MHPVKFPPLPSGQRPKERGGRLTLSSFHNALRTSQSIRPFEQFGVLPRLSSSPQAFLSVGSAPAPAAQPENSQLRSPLRLLTAVLISTNWPAAYPLRNSARSLLPSPCK